jgi:sec-independent protein translocase protein TatA
MVVILQLHSRMNLFFKLNLKLSIESLGFANKLSKHMLVLIPGGYEWIFIILIRVVIIFGAKKIPELARSFSKATSEFEKASILAKNEVDKLHDADRVTREKLESIADTLRIDYIGKDDESLKKDIDAAIKRDKEYDI